MWFFKKVATVAKYTVAGAATGTALGATWYFYLSNFIQLHLDFPVPPCVREEAWREYNADVTPQFMQARDTAEADMNMQARSQAFLLVLYVGLTAGAITGFVGGVVKTFSNESYDTIKHDYEALSNTSPDLLRWIDTCGRDSITNEQYIENLGKQEDDIPIEWLCQISFAIPAIPVRLNGRLYNYQSLLTWHHQNPHDPVTQNQFSLRDIQPARDWWESVERILTTQTPSPV